MLLKYHKNLWFPVEISKRKRMCKNCLPNYLCFKIKLKNSFQVHDNCIVFVIRIENLILTFYPNLTNTQVYLRGMAVHLIFNWKFKLDFYFCSAYL